MKVGWVESDSRATQRRGLIDVDSSLGFGGVDVDGGRLSVCHAWTWGDWTGLDWTLKNGIHAT
jgi:hypothetical protein